MRIVTVGRVGLSLRKGGILVLASVVLIVMLLFVVLVVDLGFMTLSKNQLQSAADAAALAAARELTPDARPAFPLKSPLPVAVNISGPLSLLLQKDLKTTLGLLGQQVTVIDPAGPELDREAVIAAAVETAARHRTPFHKSLAVHSHDVDISTRSEFRTSPPLLPIPLVDNLVSDLLLARHNAWPNQVEVSVRCDGQANAAIPMFFAPICSKYSQASVRADASAALLRGHTALAGAKVLPIAMDITIWRALRLGNGAVNGVPLVNQLLAPNGAPFILLDEQAWDSQSQQLSRGSDGVWEVLLLTAPTSSVGGAVGGLLGSVGLPAITLPDVATIVTIGFDGSIRNNTVKQQILNGLELGDLQNGRLHLPATLRGNATASDSTLDALYEIRGEPRVILLFETLSGTVGNTVKGVLGKELQYRIVGWGGCVITDVRKLGLVNLIGLQPAPFVSSRIHSMHIDQPVFSDLVFRAPVLVE